MTDLRLYQASLKMYCTSPPEGYFPPFGPGAYCNLNGLVQYPETNWLGYKATKDPGRCLSTCYCARHLIAYDPFGIGFSDTLIDPAPY